MWFWSVSWSTNCPVYFSFFLVDQKKICPVSDLFCSLSWIFCPVFFKKWEIDRTIGRPRDWPKPHFQKRLDKKVKRVNKKDLILDKFFFGRPKKMRNRLDNWSTKRLTKTTWTGLLCFVEFLGCAQLLYSSLKTHWQNLGWNVSKSWLQKVDFFEKYDIVLTYVNYGSSITTSKVSQIISVMKT